MDLRAERFLADQNIQPAVLSWLVSEGIDVMSVQERLDHRALDEDIWRVAGADGRIILTHDRDSASSRWAPAPAGSSTFVRGINLPSTRSDS